jgi:cytochrome c biogenesis protein CcmG/thiol:disulfide interchange protein DsbE
MKKIHFVVFTILTLVLLTVAADRITRVKPGFVRKPDSARVQPPEPELTLKDLDNRDVSLSQYKGKVVLVNFWATWCEACKEEVPSLIEMDRQYGQKGLVILGVSMDDEGRGVVAPFVERTRWDVDGQKLPMNYQVVAGNEDAADKFGGVIGLPTSILVSRDGKQIRRITGVVSYDEMAKAVESQL